MSTDTLSLRTAQQHVENYRRESSDLMARHAEAMDCRDCEAFLQIGIDAYQWLMRADREYRRGVYQAIREHSPEVENILLLLCKGWLGPCEYAEKWASLQQQRSFDVDNLERFRECCQEMRAIVAANEHVGEDVLPGPLATMRDAAIEEHLRGETAEFI